MRFVYVCLTHCYVLPLTIAIWLRTIFGRGEDLERLGRSLPQFTSDSRPVWLVASSVGEVTIALKVIDRLKQSTKLPVILSVTTPTGRARARQAQRPPDAVFFHPFDTSRIVNRVLNHFRPQLLILVETELWPILMEKTLEANIAITQISGRLSEKSHARYRGLRPYFAPILQRCSLLMMQSEADAERIREIAGPGVRIEVIGSIKEDYVAPEPGVLSEVESALAAWKGLTIFTCGSTRPSEEEILCDAFVRLRNSRADLRLILVPRHLERTSEVEEIVCARKLSFQRWTSGRLARETEVLILDTIGKLNAVYHRSDIAFVGGTLAPLGGHNLLEPALAGCPVLHGPHFFQQLRGHELLQRFDLSYLVGDADAIISVIEHLIGSGNPREIVTANSARLRASSSHILDLYVERLLSTLAHE